MRRVLLLAAALALPACAAAETLTPGMYRSTSQSPGEKPETSEQCVTQKDIDEGLSGLGMDKDANCKVHGFKRSSNSVSYTSACSSNGVSLTSKVRMAFTRETFDMQVAMTVAGETNTVRVTGRRIGACK